MISFEERRGPYEVVREEDLEMQTRDGVTLRADVYRPQADGPLPVLVRRTPYGKRVNDLAMEFNEAQWFASNGYLVVVQDTRGRFASEGRFYPFIYEGVDSYDAIEWAAGLPGSTGKVGTFGQSYGASLQYQAAVLRPPHMTTAIPVSGNLHSYENSVFHGGLFELRFYLSYFVNMAQDTLQRQGKGDDFAKLLELLVDPEVRFSPLKDEVYFRLPLRRWIDELGDAVPFLEDYFIHTTDGPYWWATDVRRQLHNIDIPILHVGSWYDFCNLDTLVEYEGVRDKGLGEHTRAHQALLMGPWAHLLPYNQPTSTGTGDIDFGPEAERFILGDELAWFDHFLKGPGEGLPCPAVRLFVMGEDHWRDEHEWPLARTQFTPWYLHSGGGAATLDGDGTLSPVAPTDEPGDSYRYDPDDPVPTFGGHYIGVGTGVQDQRATESRPDVLVYTSAPLDHDLEVTGPVQMVLHAATSAPDTDFTAVLCDVRPDGYAHNIADGVVRASFRERYDEPSPVQPGQDYEFRINLWNVSHLVRAGHRLRVHISSSDFPRWDRNPNTGKPFGTDTTTVVAEQTVFHDTIRPSHVVLPVIPR
jgi:putative CocE/NonD family hydrolase